MKLVIHFKENEWKTTCLKLLVWQARLSKTFAKIQYLMSAAFGEAIQCSIWPDQTDKLANIGANPTPSKKNGQTDISWQTLGNVHHLWKFCLQINRNWKKTWIGANQISMKKGDQQTDKQHLTNPVPLKMEMILNEHIRCFCCKIYRSQVNFFSNQLHLKVFIETNWTWL